MRRFLIFVYVTIVTGNQYGYDYKQIGQNIQIGNSNDEFNNQFGGATAQNDNGVTNSFGSGFNGLVDNSAQDHLPAPEADANGSTGEGTPRDDINGQQITYTSQTQSEYNKEYFSYAAPEEDVNEDLTSESVPSSIKKNIRVIFIKTPEHQGAIKAALQLAQQASEEKTAIYVLTKQADLADLANKLQEQTKNQSHKPEVHFVKYKTPEEALRAQQLIQAQYDQLGGPSHSSNEGAAPVLNFVSPKSMTNGNSASGRNENKVRPSYLPPSLRF